MHESSLGTLRASGRVKHWSSPGLYEASTSADQQPWNASLANILEESTGDTLLAALRHSDSRIASFV